MSKSVYAALFVRVPVALHHLIKAYAKKHSLTITEAAREIIEAGLGIREARR